jgi:hypothetical protein
MPALTHTGKKPRTTHAAVTIGGVAAIIVAIRRRSRLSRQGLLRSSRLGARRRYSQLTQPVPGLHRFV